MTGIITDIADLAEQLCDPHRHSEDLWEWTESRHRRKTGVHVTTQPGLLTQLHQAVVPLLGAPDDGGAQSAARSRPPIQLEALDRHTAITMAAAQWCNETGLRTRLTAVGNIRQLVGATSRLDCSALRVDLRRWRDWSATMTGWRTIYRPRAACPVDDCGQRSTIRINLGAQTGMCTACLSTWDPVAIKQLAEHITGQRSQHQAVRIRGGIAGRQGNGGWASRAVIPR